MGREREVRHLRRSGISCGARYIVTFNICQYALRIRVLLPYAPLFVYLSCIELEYSPFYSFIRFSGRVVLLLLRRNGEWRDLPSLYAANAGGHPWSNKGPRLWAVATRTVF